MVTEHEFVTEEIINEAAEKAGLHVVSEPKFLSPVILYEKLPFMFRKDNSVKKAPGYKVEGSLFDMMTRQVKHAERQRHFIEKGEQLVIYTDAGTLIVSEEIRDTIHALDLYAAICTKGWSISTTQF